MATAKVDEMIINLETRIEFLESRNVFQDDVIEQLSKELAIHHKQITEIQAQLKLMANRIKESVSSQGDVQGIELPPPHF